MQDQHDPIALIVEDEATVARLLQAMLRAQGYTALVAPDAATALCLLQAVRPELMTLDLNLPGMSGVALLRNLRANAATASLPVIVISAFPEGEPDAARYAQAVIGKPFDLRVLATTVRSLRPQEV